MASIKKIGTVYFDNKRKIVVMWKQGVTYQKQVETVDKLSLLLSLKNYCISQLKLYQHKNTHKSSLSYLRQDDILKEGYSHICKYCKSNFRNQKPSSRVCDVCNANVRKRMYDRLRKRK